jgi:hypothetical protein
VRAGAVPSSVDAWLRTRPARRVVVFTVGLVVLAFLLAGWSGMTRLGDSGVIDSGAFAAYADTLRETGRLPTAARNYEYTLPPGYPVLGAYVDRLAGAVSFDAGRPLEVLPSWLRRGLWAVLAAAALLALTLGEGRGSRSRLVGIVAAVVAAVWASVYVVTFVHEQPWAAKPLLTLAITACLPVVSALLAREAWPLRVYAPALAAAAVALLPTVFRIGIVFHPDPLFALLTTVALLLILAARRGGWAPWSGIWVGAALGGTALVRQSAPIVILSLAVVVILLGRRQAVRFGIVALVATLLVAGPWWGYQAHRLGNPIESNLDRPGYMLDRQPRSFFVSLPLPDLLTHPYRESFKNELLPKFHADLWSDWFGANHNWQAPSRVDRVVASSQSILGFGGDALVLGGLIGLGWPALRRAIRNPRVDRADAVLAACTTLFVLGWLAYIVTLIRFPQADGDPIQAHYLLFLAPAAAIFAVAAARWAWLRAGVPRIALLSWLTLYLVSFLALLATSF